MNEKFDGYVVYYNGANKEQAFGIVSDDYECKATSDYIPSRLKDFLIHIEDRNFYKHNGIDFKGVARAFIENVKAKKIVQGGSSITQQLARNILKDNKKSFSRKIRETIKALEIESRYSKEEILNLYFNNVYFGKNLRGIRAAGLYYFDKEVDKLTQIQLLTLLTILRGPNYYLSSPEKITKRFQLLNRTLYDHKVISKSRFQKNLKTNINLGTNKLQTIKNNAIPFITENINKSGKKIKSTIDNDIQSFAKKVVLDSIYPVSIVAIRNKRVIAFASSYGTDYPFISKSNVGSTLKPFLYCHLRDCGISQTEKFNAFQNELNWNVREVRQIKPLMSLEEALFYSNNNTFINACHKNNIETSLAYLSSNFNKDRFDFFPSSILGATKNGISLYELALTYSNFFSNGNLSESKKECLNILNKIANDKLGFKVENVFLKTGTTNENKERYALLGNPDITFAILRNENLINDESKEGGFMTQISRSFYSMFYTKRNYKWI